MAQSLRMFYRGVQGRVRKNVNWGPINEKSAVIVTAGEWTPSGGIVGPEIGRYLLGEATVWVSNVGPHGDEGGGGGVEFHLHADWGSPIDVMATITVLEDYEQFASG